MRTVRNRAGVRVVEPDLDLVMEWLDIPAEQVRVRAEPGLFQAWHSHSTAKFRPTDSGANDDGFVRGTSGEYRWSWAGTEKEWDAEARKWRTILIVAPDAPTEDIVRAAYWAGLTRECEAPIHQLWRWQEER